MVLVRLAGFSNDRFIYLLLLNSDIMSIQPTPGASGDMYHRHGPGQQYGRQSGQRKKEKPNYHSPHKDLDDECSGHESPHDPIHRLGQQQIFLDALARVALLKGADIPLIGRKEMAKQYGDQDAHGLYEALQAAKAGINEKSARAAYRAAQHDAQTRPFLDVHA
jgi:hypothetical protein